MNEKLKSRLFRTISLCLIGLFAGATIGFIQIRSQTNATVINKGSTELQSMPGIQIGGPFSLTNQDGNLVTEKTFAGQYKLVYFGFTMCPMICPAGMLKIANTLRLMGDKADKIQPILITVDPDRDTPDMMKLYVKQFHPRFIGLTGTKADLEAVQKSYRVFAARVEDNDMSGYTMDHSSFIYFMGPNDELIALYRDADTPQMISQDMLAKVD